MGAPDETGWKLVHAAVLVAPGTPFLLSVVPTCKGNPLWLETHGKYVMVRLAEEHGTDLAQYRPLLFHAKSSLS